MNKSTIKTLKRSQFILAIVRAARALRGDIQVLFWLSKRKVKIANYLKNNKITKLQLGTSNNALAGWLNTDVAPTSDSVIFMDATNRFPFDDETFDYVMAEHMIEHIDYDFGQSMLSECFRVLKQNGRARFATPDLTVLLELHSKNKTAEQARYVDWLCARLFPKLNECKDVFVINNCFRAWGHSFIYDPKTLRHALESCGFRDIQFFKPGVSNDPVLQALESHGKEIDAEDINQFETMVIEGRK